MKIKDKEKLFNEIKEEYKNIFQEVISSISIYGSAVTSNFNPSTSDINVAIILKDLKLKSLIPAKKVIKKFKKQRVSAPLFLSKKYIDSSLDTFPIEFLEIKSNHRTIYGQDYFEDISIKRKIYACRQKEN